MNLPASAELARRCLEKGVESLAVEEESWLRQLFLKEARKGAFRWTGADPANIRADFCRHVVREFHPAPNALVVVDFQPLLRRQARELAAQGAPLASLILYATWLEHWTNMVISVAMFRRGDQESAVQSYFAERPRFKSKLGLLGAGLGLSLLPKKERDAAIQLVRTRNRYVHYSWQGRSARWFQKDLAGVRSVVSRAEGLLDSLTQYEYANLDRDLTAIANTMFPRAGAG